MRSKTFEKWMLCSLLILSLSSAAYLYSKSNTQNDLARFEAYISADSEFSKSLPDTKIIDYIIDKAEDIMTASIRTNCIH